VGFPFCRGVVYLGVPGLAGLRLAIVAVIALSLLVAPPLSRAVAASGTTMFVQQFNHSTVNSTYPGVRPLAWRVRVGQLRLHR
jgi:hypothetical protein